MSFMYNPFPFDDPKPINRPKLSEKTINSVVSGGTMNVAAILAKVLEEKLAKSGKNVVVALDGYTTANWTKLINLLHHQFNTKKIELEVVNFSKVYKTEEEVNELIDKHLMWDKSKDPTLLFGKIYHGGYEGIFDSAKLEAYKNEIKEAKSGSGKVVIVVGYGCLVKDLRELYDLKCYFDVTPKESMLRIRRGAYINLAKKSYQTVNLTIRRCYYGDFEMAVALRKDLLRNDILDYYFASDNPDKIQMLPGETLKDILATMTKYPFRCKPVYLEGVWGGSYFRNLRDLPDEMRNCAWIFDLIPMEVSLVVEVGKNLVEFPFCSFFMKEAEKVMGEACFKKYHGYFPIRFNYDDSYHSTGNMSIQCHSDAEYNKKNFNELGRQDESYYVVATGHDAKTFVGFRDDADIPQFFKDIQKADTEYVPVDYMKYVHYEESKPGLQVMLPAGTIHSSGRNQIVLEIGSLTIGSYTYKLYDYLRLDFDGKPRPIHTKMGKETIKERRTSWVRDNIVQKPRVARHGEGWAEYIVGEHDLLYFSLRRFEFEKQIEDDTNGKFHVLALVDGDRVRVRSIENPEHYYDAEFLDIIVVPASMGKYVVENLGKEPICIHKTMLKDGFEND